MGLIMVVSGINNDSAKNFCVLFALYAVLLASLGTNYKQLGVDYYADRFYL